MVESIKRRQIAADLHCGRVGRVAVPREEAGLLLGGGGDTCRQLQVAAAGRDGAGG